MTSTSCPWNEDCPSSTQTIYPSEQICRRSDSFVFIGHLLLYFTLVDLIISGKQVGDPIPVAFTGSASTNPSVAASCLVRYYFNRSGDF